MTVSLDFLDQEALRNPSRLHLLKLEAVMLAPNDHALRGELEASSSVAYWIENAFCLSDDGKISLMKDAHRATPIKELEPLARSRYIAGIVAGSILREIVGNRTKAESVKEGVAKIFADEGVTVKKINDEIWTRCDPNNPRAMGMRSVSPLWAAHVQIARQTDDITFPCRRAKLAEFLARADSFRRIAVQTKLPRAPATILWENETYAVPEQLLLPNFELLPTR
jgi:hypothetical protein